MWGTRSSNPITFDPSRIIPTYVGNTLEEYKPKGLLEDHPYVCGEHMAINYLESTKSGSSLRMWGTPRMCGLG